MVTAQNALPLTAKLDSYPLSQSRYEVGRRARCTCRYFCFVLGTPSTSSYFFLFSFCERLRATATCLPAHSRIPSAGDMTSNCTSAAPISASKTKTKKKHFIGQKVKLFRASEPILSVFMWGVNHTVSVMWVAATHSAVCLCCCFDLASLLAVICQSSFDLSRSL